MPNVRLSGIFILYFVAICHRRRITAGTRHSVSWLCGDLNVSGRSVVSVVVMPLGRNLITEIAIMFS